MRVVDVEWRLDLRHHEKTFGGTVSVRVEGAGDPLVLDAAHLTIESATLDGHPTPYREDAAHGTLEFPGISTAPHRLEIAYRGAAEANSLVGLYVAPCGPGYALTTMMFPTGSGRLLPSFEHPSVKTVYRLVLTVEDGVTVVFNTAVRAERRIDGRRELTFDPTPPMSAYLLYLGVGPFETLTVPGDRWSVTVATSPGRASAGRFCGERTAELLAAYEEYYGTPYPLPKLDLVALENFWAGAMENWGAIAFRENAVLVDSTTSALERQTILAILAHEIAHQWFGNLVTPAGWDDFWLNESFATFVGYRIVSRRYPEEDADSYLFNRWIRPAFQQDALSSSHPIKVPVASPEALGEVSDEVTYGKGAAVLRMVEAYLGEEVFRRGISHYLAQHRYANARAEDLWTALDEVSHRPVGRIMTQWITRTGYPVIHAHWADGALELRQERYRADGGASVGQWPIPLRISSLEGDHTALFEGPEMTLPLRSPQGLRIDPGRTAFARVHYDPALFARMVAELPSLAPIDQWGLVVDSHSFVYAGLIPVGSFLELVDAGSSLSAELPALALVQALSDLFRPLHDVPAFLRAARRFLRAQLRSIGLDHRPDEPGPRGMLREMLARTLVRMDPEFARELAPRFAEFDRLPAELRRAVATAYAITEGAAALDPLIARLGSTTRESERMEMAEALTAFQDPTLVHKVLELGAGALMTPGGLLELLGQATANPVGGRVLYEWYRSHSAALSEKWAGTPLLSLFLRFGLVAMGLEDEEAVTQYFRQHAPPGATVGIEQGLETLRLAAGLRRRALGTGRG